jgi:putative endonuclease
MQVKNWFVYIIRSSDNSFYTGITTDYQRRFHQHAQLKSGAKYFRGRTPEAVVYLEVAANRSLASKREVQIKRLSRSEKIVLINSRPFCYTGD